MLLLLLLLLLLLQLRNETLSTSSPIWHSVCGVVRMMANHAGTWLACSFALPRLLASMTLEVLLLLLLLLSIFVLLLRRIEGAFLPVSSRKSGGISSLLLLLLLLVVVRRVDSSWMLSTTVGALRVVTLVLAVPVIAAVRLLAVHALLRVSLRIGERHHGHGHVAVHIWVAHRIHHLRIPEAAGFACCCCW
jgi:hypothetical protein